MLSRIIKGWPNTYTFTKALAEKMLLQLGDKLPIVIVRPSIGKFQLILVQIIVINFTYKTRVCTSIKHHLFQSRIALNYLFLFFVLFIAFFCTNTVTASWREPILGWVDNLNGPTGLLAGAGKGVLRTLLCHKDLIADLVPVDICINLLISAAWYTAINR